MVLRSRAISHAVFGRPMVRDLRSSGQFDCEELRRRGEMLNEWRDQCLEACRGGRPHCAEASLLPFGLTQSSSCCSSACRSRQSVSCAELPRAIDVRPKMRAGSLYEAPHSMNDSSLLHQGKWLCSYVVVRLAVGMTTRLSLSVVRSSRSMSRRTSTPGASAESSACTPRGSF